MKMLVFAVQFSRSVYQPSRPAPACPRADSGRQRPWTWSGPAASQSHPPRGRTGRPGRRVDAVALPQNGIEDGNARLGKPGSARYPDQTE